MDQGPASSLSPSWTRAAVIGLAVLFALFVWFVAAASAALDFAVAVVAAVAWCVWLDRSAGL